MPSASVQVRVAVKVPTVSKRTLPGLCNVELSIFPPLPKNQRNENGTWFSASLHEPAKFTLLPMVTEMSVGGLSIRLTGG
jgi:hypothetical protein